MKQENQDDFTRATRTVAKSVEKYSEADSGILNTYFELLQFIEVIYIRNKCIQYIVFPS